MMWLCNPHAIPAHTGFVHGLAERGKRIDQIITALANRGRGPLRIRPAVAQGGVEARRTGDGVEHGAVAAHFRDKLKPLNTGHHFKAAVSGIAVTGINHIFHIQRIAFIADQLMRTEELQRLPALLPLMDHRFKADVGGCFFVDQADSAQLFFTPFTAQLPQLAIPPVRAEHTSQRGRDQIIGHWLASVLFAAQPLKGRGDYVQAHRFRRNKLPCLADLLWCHVVTDEQMAAGFIKTHAHVRSDER